MKFAITKSVDLEDGKITWSINPELLRIYSYLFFWTIVFFGWYFTKHHSDVDFHDNILTTPMLTLHSNMVVHPYHFLFYLKIQIY